METVITIVILIIMAFGVFYILHTDASGGQKLALIVLWVLVGGAIAAFAGTLLMVYPVITYLIVFVLGGTAIVFAKRQLDERKEKKEYASSIAKNDSVDSTDELRERFNGVKKGQIVPFGPYDWKVLTVQDGKALLITKDIIAKRKYGKGGYGHYPYWRDSSLRDWLNKGFLKGFSAAEINMISSTDVRQKIIDSKSTSTVSTRDRVFLLSREEADSLSLTRVEPLPVLPGIFSPILR